MDDLKKAAAEAALAEVADGMTIGLGTGSTAYHFINGLGRLVNEEGWKVQCVATSVASEKQARELGIPLIPLDRVDVVVDGADEFDTALHLIKGGGGALTREKIVASAATKMVVIADERKDVKVLGKFPLPVEIIPLGASVVARKVEQMGAVVGLRKKEGDAYVTDNGNWILDCAFGEIADPPGLEKAINDIPGVVTNGLFVGMATVAYVASEKGVYKVIPSDQRDSEESEER